MKIPAGIKAVEYGSMQYKTYVEIDGEEWDVVVNYYSSPDEPDVNSEGGVEIESVLWCPTHRCVLSEMSSGEQDALQERLVARENSRHNPDNYEQY